MLIFRYILKDFIKYAAGTIFLCVFLFVMFDFIHKTTKYFAIYNPSAENIAKFYLYQIPLQLPMALPIASLLASVITMVLLSRTNEITAMRASGMGPYQVAMPIAVGGVILCGLSFILGEYIIPRTSEKMHYVQQVLIEGEEDEQMAGSRWLREKEKLYTFREYEPLSMTILNLLVIETGMNFRPKSTIEAETAIYNAHDNIWDLNNVRLIEFDPTGVMADFQVDRKMQISLPFEPKKLRKDRRKPNELSLVELYDAVSKGKQSGADISQMNVEMHMKFALHFAAFVVSLIGVKFAYRSERSVESVVGIFLAVMTGLFYWVFWNAGRAMGIQGTLPAPIAAWMANVVIFSAGMFGIWKARFS